MNERESCRALRPPDLSGSRGRDNRAAVYSHRSPAIGGLLMAHLYKKRAANHWKRPPRFERRESEQEEEESQPLRRKSGRPRSLKDIIKAKTRRRAPWK